MARSMGTCKIGIIGTFDVENYGDLLFPYLAEHELSARLGELTLRRYSYHRKDPGTWPYEVRSTEDFVRELDELDGLVVGGGHLVRFDPNVAPGYRPTAPALHHPTSLWLTPVLAAASAGLPIAWNAVGASSGTPEWARPWLRDALGVSRYVSVRDEPSRDELRDVAPDADVLVTPDSAFGLRETVDRLVPRSHVDGLLSRLGVSRPFVVVQPSSRLETARPQLEVALPHLTAAGMDLLELPISPALGDRCGRLGLDVGLVPVEPWPAPLLLAALVGQAAGVVAHSLHLSITALATGVPVHRLPAPPNSKYRLLEAFPSIHHFTTEGRELADHVLHAAKPDDQALDVARVAVTAHWDRVAAALSGDGDSDSAAASRAAVRRFLMTVPTSLERLVGEQREIIQQRDLARRDRERLERDLAAERHRADQLVERLERDLAAERHRADQLAERAETAAQELQTSQQDVREIRERLRTTERTLRLLRTRRAVRLALEADQRLRPTLKTLRGLWRKTQTAHRTSTPPQQPPRQASPKQQADLVAQLSAELPKTTVSGGPRVSVVMLNRSGAHYLRRCLPGLQSTTYTNFELIVVDNGSEDDSLAYLQGLATRFPLRVIRNAENRSFSTATNQGVAASDGELILLLNNDIEPITPEWLGRMVETLQARDAVAVGARLIYPRRPRSRGADVSFDDLSLQHRGVGFRFREGIPRAVNLGAGTDARSAEARAVRDIPMITAACLLVRRDAYESVGGLEEAYEYGTEDVDLCLKLRQAGGRLVYDGGVALWHHEFGTQEVEQRERLRERRQRNYERFLDRWGPQVYREVLLDRLAGARHWSEDPLHVAITVTRNDPQAGWGDYFTAHELGDELTRLGWRVSYVERHRDRWYTLPSDVDVLLCLLDRYDLTRAPTHVIKVAWVRNWTERWLSHPWFDDYDLVLASSNRSKELIEQHSAKTAHLLPLATNPARFRPTPRAQPDTDVLFAGSYWNKPRGVTEALPRLPAGLRTRVYGKGWEKVPALAGLHRGFLRYEQLPEAYSRACIVLDDTAFHARPYAAVNSRVFDALAAGALVLTDNVEGARELFDEEFPVYETGEALPQRVAELLADPQRVNELVERYRRTVLERHTYDIRARQLRELLVSWASADRVDIAIGVPRRSELESWGDYHFARAMQRVLERRGLPTRVSILPDWGRPTMARSDVVLHLFGLSDLRTRPSQVSVLWNISHPDRVTPERCAAYDLVLVASKRFADRVREWGMASVGVLHQATDPDRFRPDPTGPAHELLFVGNSRRVRRRILEDLLPTRHDLAVYGRNWTPDLIDLRYVRGEHIRNQELTRYYTSAAIVLNDHWDDMRSEGFLSNRLYDALAAGAFVLSDHVEGIDEEFDGGVVTYRGRQELAELVDRFLADPEARRDHAQRGREAVLGRHTFARRADELLAWLEPLLLTRQRVVDTELRVEPSAALIEAIP